MDITACDQNCKQFEMDECYEVALGLTKGYGGGTSTFEKALGELLKISDGPNSRKIKTAWPHQWNVFWKVGKMLHEEEDQ